MEEKKSVPKFKEVLRTYNHADVAFIKSLLESSEVLFYVNNENVNYVGSLTFAEPMRVRAEESSYESVKELLDSFPGKFGKFSMPEEDRDEGR